MLTRKQICMQIKPEKCKIQQKGLGGCAFDGAQIVLVPITDAAHLVHGPAGCTANSWNIRGSSSSSSLLYKRCFTTNLNENDIIFGGEERLVKSIEYIHMHYAPSAIFVYSTCVTALIGEDITRVCKNAEKKLNVPVIPVESPGYGGSKNFGNRVAGETLLEYVIGTREPENTTRYDLNLIGEYNIAGELWSIKSLLNRLGIRLMSVMTGDSKYNDIAISHRAKLNIMVCSRALLSIARTMKERYLIPYLEESFFGIQNTSNALRNIAGFFNEPDLIKLADSLIKDEEEALNGVLDKYRNFLNGKKVLLYTGGVKSWSIISALQDLGMDVIGCGIRKSTDEDIKRIKELLGEGAHFIENTSPKMLLEKAKELKADIIVAGGRNQYTALKARIPYLDINQDREVAYTGYDGIKNLAEMLCNTLSSPIWGKIKEPKFRDKEVLRHSFKEEAIESKIAIYPVNNKSLTINPLSASQPLGAVIAFLGIHNAIPLMHGCQGCNAFSKAMLNRHFREPAYIHTTGLMETEVIMDGGEYIIKGVNKLIDSQNPEVIGVISTGLTEVKGDDVSGAIREFIGKSSSRRKVQIVPVSTPDYDDSMQDGYAKTVTSIVESQIFVCEKKDTTEINLLPASFLTPADIIELKEATRSFGLNPVVLPDISGSLDGHLDEKVSFISKGGIKISDIRLMGSSIATISIGESMRKPASMLEEKTGVAGYHLDSLLGLDGFDKFIGLLSQISGKPVPEKFKRQRSRLADAMLDTHFYIGGKKFALALESDLLVNISGLILEIGGEIGLAVTQSLTNRTKNVKAQKIMVGDLDDLEQYGTGADMVISNSNAIYAAKALEAPLLRMGFPVVDRLGVGQKLSVGYKGSMNLLFEIGNNFIEHR